MKYELSEQCIALFSMDLSSFIFLSQLSTNNISRLPADMELDPTKNDNLHLYIWKKLMAKIEAEL
jgi:hypothetical protein